MQTAGVVLDIYDDVSGQVLLSILGVDKTAGRPLTAADRAEIKGSHFALPKQRKYPIHDADHARSALSMVAKHGTPGEQAAVRKAVAQRYPGIGKAKTAGALPEILKDASLLPPDRHAALPDRDFALVLHNGGEPLRKYAMHDSAHLVTSTLYFLKCGHLLPEEAQKVAATNLVHAHEWYDMSPPDALVKQADLVGTDTMPAGVSKSKAVRTNVNKHNTTPWKAASADPNVDVRNLLPKAQLREQSPMHTCLGGEYPIDTYEQVKAAEGYFNEHSSELSPLDRREYAVNLEKRAADLGVQLEGRVCSYSGSSFGTHVFEEIEKRAASFEGRPQANVFRTLKAKVASGAVSPDVTAALLHQADLAFGLDRAYGKAVVGFLDPIEAVYGVEKTAIYRNDVGGRNENDSYTWSLGSDYVTGDALRQLSGSEALIKGVLADKEQKAFEEQPVKTFKSLPEPQKHALARLAALASNGRSY